MQSRLKAAGDLNERTRFWRNPDIEEELKGGLIPGCPDLLARIDLIIDTGEELVVRDFKTARSRWSQSTADSYGEQILLYSQLAGRLAPDRKLCLEFLVTSKAKTLLRAADVFAGQRATRANHAGCFAGRLRVRLFNLRPKWVNKNSPSRQFYM